MMPWISSGNTTIESPIFILRTANARRAECRAGTGDTPIKEFLTLILDNGWPIYEIIEREFRGPGTPVEETRGQLAYLRSLRES